MELVGGGSVINGAYPILRGNMKVSLGPSYISWSRNRTAKAGGGVATAVAREHMDKTGEAGEGVGDDEYLITRSLLNQQ